MENVLNKKDNSSLNKDELLLLIETMKSQIQSEFSDMVNYWNDKAKMIEDSYFKLFDKMRD